MKIGSIDVVGIPDGHGKEALDEVVGRDDAAAWDCPEHPLDDEGRITLDFGGFLIRTADRTILVDGGIGPRVTDKWTGGALVENLAQHGLDVDDITDVLYTHLHFDHVGWATQQGRITFPNATYRIHRADWEHFVDRPGAAAGAVRKLGPIAEHLETFDTEVELAPGVIARPAPGHTPGSTIFVVASGGQRALLLGDVVHAVGELTDPHWHGLYDLDPEGARTLRDAIADEAAEAGDLIAAAHFPGLRFGRLVVTPERRTFAFVS